MKRRFFSGVSIPWVQLCLIFLGIALWPEMELLVPSLPSMKAYFAVSEGQIQQVLSANFIGFLFGVLLAGPLCDSFGRKKTTVYGLIFFVLASAVVSIADSLSVMMVARFIQGIAVTAPIIGGITMLLETTQGSKQVFWMSISSASITFAMASAPLLGAVINQHFGFRGNLWAIAIAGAVVLIPFIVLVPETLAKKMATPLSGTSIIRSYSLIVRNKNFMALAIAVAALPAAYWIYAGVSSLYLVEYLGVDPALFGSYQAPITGTFAVLSLSMSFLARRIGTKTCLQIGFYLMLIGSGGLMIMSMLHKESAILSTALMVFFVGGMVPANSLLFPAAIQQLPPQLQGSGQSLIQALRLFFASIGTMILGVSYTGSFAPVAILLLVLFLLSSFLIFLRRNEIDQAASLGETAIAACH